MQQPPEQGAPPEAAPPAQGGGVEEALGQIDNALGALTSSLGQAGAPPELLEEGAALGEAFKAFAQKIVGAAQGGGDPTQPDPQPVDQAGGATPVTPGAY